MEFNKKDMLFIVRNNNLILTWVLFNECCSASATWKCGINKSILNAAINYLNNVFRWTNCWAGTTFGCSQGKIISEAAVPSCKGLIPISVISVTRGTLSRTRVTFSCICGIKRLNPNVRSSRSHPQISGNVTLMKVRKTLKLMRPRVSGVFIRVNVSWWKARIPNWFVWNL